MKNHSGIAVIFVLIFIPVICAAQSQYLLEGPSEVMEGYIKNGVSVRGQAQYSLLFCPTGQHCQKIAPQDATWSVRAPAATLEGIKPAPVISVTGFLRVGRVVGAKNISIRCRFTANDGTTRVLSMPVRIVEVSLSWFSYPHGNPAFADWTVPDLYSFPFSIMATYAGGTRKLLTDTVNWSVKYDPYSTAPTPYFVGSIFYPGDLRIISNNKVTITGRVTVGGTRYTISHPLTILNRYGW